MAQDPFFIGWQDAPPELSRRSVLMAGAGLVAGAGTLGLGLGLAAPEPGPGGWDQGRKVAVTGTMDAHFTALWDYGHIKFFSIKTLTELLEETGFEVERFLRVGRIPPLAKSMIAVARKPKG